MTTEQKQLLFTDLCAKLPYGVKISITAHNLDYEKDFGKTVIAELTGIHTAKDNDGTTHTCFITCYDEFKTQGNDIDTIKPFLRPMSSMGEDEKEEFRVVGGVTSYNPQNDSWAISAFTPEAYDWLNKNHFDYRGLIPMGLALEAPEGMYK